MYKEKIDCGNMYRQEYRKGIEDLIKNLASKAKDNRKGIVEGIKSNPEEYRQKLKDMLGWPINGKKEDGIPKVNKIFVANDGEVSIYRMQIFILDMPFYGILFVKEDGKKRPLVIVQHGGLGAPEECANFLESGTANYNDMINRVLKYDVNVFAPQLLLWRQEFSYDEYKGVDITYTDAMRWKIDKQLKQLGSSIAAVEIYCITRVIDYFENEPYLDDGKIGMLGFSYGGFYTLYTTAVEKRIKCGFSCSFFNDRIKHNWDDWVWFNSANTFTDIETALLAEDRPLYICISYDDQGFDFESGKRIWSELESELTESNNIRFVEFEGRHEFITEDEPIQAFVNELLDS